MKTPRLHHRKHKPAAPQRFPTLPLALPGLPPRPDPTGIAEVRAHFQTCYQRDITEAEAEEVLTRLLRFLWAINLPSASEKSNQEETTSR